MSLAPFFGSTLESPGEFKILIPRPAPRDGLFYLKEGPNINTFLLVPISFECAVRVEKYRTIWYLFSLGD